jgi:hypothetical protein
MKEWVNWTAGILGRVEERSRTRNRNATAKEQEEERTQTANVRVSRLKLRHAKFNHSVTKIA